MRNLAHAEPLAARARALYTVPTQIPQAQVDAMPLASRNFLTANPPAPPLYTLQGNVYALNYKVSELTPAQRWGILGCLNRPNGIAFARVASISDMPDSATLELYFFNTNFLNDIVTCFRRTLHRAPAPQPS